MGYTVFGKTIVECWRGEGAEQAIGSVPVRRGDGLSARL